MPIPDLEPLKNRGQPPRRVDEAGRERIRLLVENQPDATLEEICDAYNADAETGASISRQTVRREVARLGLSGTAAIDADSSERCYEAEVGALREVLVEGRLLQ